MVKKKTTLLLPAAFLGSLAACASAGAPPERPAYMIDKADAEHYVWGKENDGWHLVKQPGLSVIQERIAPGASEIRHFHRKARQFFYVLSGELTMEADGETTVLKPGEGMEIPPGMRHRAQNRSAAAVEILVTSSPKSHGDRVEAPTLAGGQ